MKKGIAKRISIYLMSSMLVCKSSPNISNNDSACHPCGHRAYRLCGHLFCHRGGPEHGHSGMADMYLR